MPINLSIFNPFNWDYSDWLNLLETNNEPKGTSKIDFDNYVPFRYDAKDGKLTLEAVVAGHKPENIKVMYSDKSHVMRIEDSVDKAEKETRSGNQRPWWYSELNMEFDVPENVDVKSFTKRIENGVLTVTATYDNQPKKEEEFEVC